MHRLGIIVETARSIEEGLAALERSDGAVGLVISEMREGEEPGAGLELLPRFRAAGSRLPVIFVR